MPSRLRYPAPLSNEFFGVRQGFCKRDNPVFEVRGRGEGINRHQPRRECRRPRERNLPRRDRCRPLPQIGNINRDIRTSYFVARGRRRNGISARVGHDEQVRRALAVYSGCRRLVRINGR